MRTAICLAHLRLPANFTNAARSYLAITYSPECHSAVTQSHNIEPWHLTNSRCAAAVLRKAMTNTAREEPISPSDQEYGSGTDVVLPDGSFLEDSQSPSGHMRAPIGDSTAVARAGRSARDQYKSMLLFPETAISATGYLLLTLGMNVGQGGDFDYQRRGNRLIGFRQFHQYWHVSNFNVGLFAQQGGLTVEEALKTAGLFARLFSNNVDPSLPYSLNPDVADYIRKGFAAGESGVFEGHPSADHK